MEPIKINIAVEVGLKQTTIDAIRQIFGAQIIPAAPCCCGTGEDQRPTPTPEPEKPKTVRATPVETRTEVDDDLPPDDAPSPKKPTPTESDARQAVKAARDRGVPAKVIKEYMKSAFDIETSVDCPEERRQELIDGLSKLAA